MSVSTLFAGAKPANERRRVAVIGHTGRGDYGHGLHTMWLSLPETEIVAVADPNDAGRASALEKLNVRRGFADYREMLAEMRPEIVAIALGHIQQHSAIAVACAEAGVRGIYVEKPFSPTLQEADQIVAACKRHNVKVAVAHRNRYHPALPTVRRLIQEGLIGQFLEMRGRGKEDARGGALDLWILGSHVLDIVRFFGGEAEACSATVRHKGRLLTRKDLIEGSQGVGLLGGDELHARFDMTRGVPAYFDSIKNAGDRLVGFGLQLIGTKGIIDLRMDTEPIAHFCEGNPFHPGKSPRVWTPISSAGVGKPEPIPNCGREVMGHRVGARDLIAAIDENREPLCSASDGRAIIEMIAAVFESHRQEGRRVTLPLADRGNPLESLPG